MLNEALKMKKLVFFLLISLTALAGKVYSSHLIEKGCELTSYGENEQRYVVLSHNFDTNIGRMEDGYARDTHPQWRAKRRIPLEKKTISTLVKKRILILFFSKKHEGSKEKMEA